LVAPGERLPPSSPRKVRRRLAPQLGALAETGADPAGAFNGRRRLRRLRRQLLEYVLQCPFPKLRRIREQITQRLDLLLRFKLCLHRIHRGSHGAFLSRGRCLCHHSCRSASRHAPAATSVVWDEAAGLPRAISNPGMSTPRPTRRPCSKSSYACFAASRAWPGPACGSGTSWNSGCACAWRRRYAFVGECDFGHSSCFGEAVSGRGGWYRTIGACPPIRRYGPGRPPGASYRSRNHLGRRG